VHLPSRAARPVRPAALRQGARRSLLGAFLALTLCLALSGCGSGLFGPTASPTATPGPDQPCGGLDEQRAAGFYPALEALLPVTVSGVRPTSRDSGRYCSAVKLGTLYTRDGYHEVHFAGAVWPNKDQTSGLSTVVYQATGLTASQVADAFAISAGDSQNVTKVASQAQTIRGRSGIRLDVINQDTSQVVLIWPAASAGTVDIVLGSDVTEQQLRAAVAAYP
jgi:hypothetical protein